MLFSSIFKKKEKKVSLLVDIGNGSISGALVLFGNDTKPNTLFGVSLPFSIAEKPETTELLKSMSSLLDKTISIVVKNGFAHPYWKNKRKKISSVVVSLSSPWFTSKVKNIHIEKDNPFVISQSFIDSIIEAEEKNFHKELSDSEYEQTFDKNISVIEKSIMKAKINGYSISKIMGKKVKILDASMYMSIISKSILKEITGKVFKYTHIPEEYLYIHTFPFVSFSVVRDLFPAKDNFFIFDVTAEVTDVTLVRDGVISKVVSFPSGRNFIIRQIAKSFKVNFEIADSLLHLYIDNKADKDVITKMTSVLLNVKKEWLIYCENALADLSGGFAFPSVVFITSEDDVASIYEDFIKNSNVSSNPLPVFDQNADVIKIDTKLLANDYNPTPKFSYDEFIGVLAVFYDKLRKQDINI